MIIGFLGSLSILFTKAVMKWKQILGVTLIILILLWLFKADILCGNPFIGFICSK